MGKNIKTLRRFLALVMAFGVVAGLCACTQQSSSSAPPSATSSESQTPDAVVAEWPDFLTVGGGSTGGVFFSAAAGIAQLLSSETDTTATAQTTTGGSQNIQLIANGEMELGIAAADACYQAWNGIGSYEKPLQEMNVICAIYSSYYQHVVRNDSKAQSFEEMAGSTQVVGGSGSGTEVSARAVLGAYGYDYLERKDLKAEFLGISEGVEKIQNKQADGMNSITPYPFSSFVELTMTDNAHLISINDEALDKLVNAEGSVYMKGIIPAGTYNNQNEDKLRIIGDRFQDFQHLRLSGRQSADLLFRVEIHLPVLEELSALVIHGAPVYKAALLRIPSHKHILCDRQILNGIELLMDHGDPQGSCVSGISDGDFFSVETDITTVRLDHSVQDLHQC